MGWSTKKSTPSASLKLQPEGIWGQGRRRKAPAQPPPDPQTPELIGTLHSGHRDPGLNISGIGHAGKMYGYDTQPLTSQRFLPDWN